MAEGIPATWAVSTDETSVFNDAEAPEFLGQLNGGWLIFQEDSALAEHVCVKSQVLGQLGGLCRYKKRF